MNRFDLVCVKGKETFGLSLWANDLKDALARARGLLRESGYSAYPKPKDEPEASPAVALAA